MARHTDQLVLGRAEVERREKDASLGATYNVLDEISVGSERGKESTLR